MLRNGIGSLSRLLLILLLVSAICAAVTIQNLGQRDDSLCNKSERQATAALDTSNAEAAVEQHGPVDPLFIDKGPVGAVVDGHESGLDRTDSPYL